MAGERCVPVTTGGGRGQGWDPRALLHLGEVCVYLSSIFLTSLRDLSLFDFIWSLHF